MTDVEQGAPSRPAPAPEGPAPASLPAKFRAGMGENLDYFRSYRQRVRGGEMGSLPAVAGLVVLVILFSVVQPTFHGRYNIGNMITEGAGPMFIAIGLVFVLLLGEIDLSAGFAGGVCAFLMARLTAGYGMPWPISIGAGLVTGVVIGLLIGWLRAKVRIPSFVVTLAFFLAFQGVALIISGWAKGPTGQIPITDRVVYNLANGTMAVWAGWLLGAVCVALYAYVKFSAAWGRRRQGLAGEPNAVLVVKVVAMAALTFAFVFLLSGNRSLNTGSSIQNVNGKLVRVAAPALEGLPWVVLLLVFLFVVLTFLLTRTRYGRHIYAVGGNEEAARRAGINVDWVRMSVFIICSFMAAVGGIAIASNVGGVAVNNYGGNTLLLAVGAAVIGGTSLFGGKGRVLDAIIGGAVVEVIQNGMADLIQSSSTSIGSGVQYMVTGLVLLLAAAVDALSRRRATMT